MTHTLDALIVGAGPAGASAAILLARAGWRVVIVEQHDYPRRKVCGECIAAGNLTLLDDLGVGQSFREAAGPDLARIGWMDSNTTLSAAMPPCRGPYAYGRALGRDRLDSLLLDRARELGAHVMQPARVLEVRGEDGNFACMIGPAGRDRPDSVETVRCAVVIDAHGSWERGPAEREACASRTRRSSDLFAFKANFSQTSLAPGLLPVLAFRGGYGGMVVEQRGRATLACCIRRDVLTALRRELPGMSAGAAVENYLRSSCPGVNAALVDAQRMGSWLSVGPVRPGSRLGAPHGAFRVGNAAGESHALIGEGISMALQSSALLCQLLIRQPAAAVRGRCAADIHRVYAAKWHRAFGTRLRLAALYSHVAMRPALTAPLRHVLHRYPTLLSRAALWAGKASSRPRRSFVDVETA